MVIEVFFKTQDEIALHTFSMVVKAHEDWRNSLLRICTQFGFKSFYGPDFCTPEYFLKERFETKVRGRGFNPVSDRSVYVQPEYEKFTLRRDYASGAEIFRQLDDISRDSLASINLTQEVYGRPNHVGYQFAACLLLGIDHTYNFGDITAFTQVWRIIGFDGSPMLISSVPVPMMGNDMQYEIPCMPPIWQDISSHEVISLFNFHNTQLTKMDLT